MKRIMPLLDRVLIRRAINKPKSAGGVLLPESALKTLNQGEVIAVGAGARDEAGKIIPLCVEVGDKVLLPEYGGTRVDDDNEDLQLFRDRDLLAIVKD